MIEPQQEDQDRNVEGQTTAITTFSTVRCSGRVVLPVLFWIVNHVSASTKKLRDLSFIDMARWCLIKELPYNGPPQASGALRYPHLFFESNFNGGWQEYIDAFSNKLSGGMRAFWGTSYGFPGPLPTEPFKSYIKANEYEADHFYVAYDATSTQIQRALALAGAPETPVGSFMAICPVRPGMREELADYLHAMERVGLSCLSLLLQTHMGRFVIVDDFHHDPAWDQPYDEHLDMPYLIFTACFDGSKDDYLDDLARLTQAVDIWGYCVGSPQDFSSVKRYLHHNEVVADVFFAAYGATVDQVRDAIERFPESDSSWASKTPRVRLHVGRVVREVAAQYAAERASNPGTIAKRDQHADEYGTIHGVLTVEPAEIRPELQYGIFASPGSYEVVCRLSPNKATPWPLCPPVGLAMKVFLTNDQDGKTQDLLLGAEVDRFFCATAEDAVELVKARVSALAGVRYVFPSLDPRRWRLLEARILMTFMTRRVQDLLAGTMYYSALPIHCGPDQLVKVSIRTPSVVSRCLSLRRPDLKTRLSKTLEDGVTVDLLLQAMTEDDDLDDPRRSSKGPWERVGTIFFPAQEPGDGEDLSFNLGNCHADHESHGEIAEVRKAVYEHISRERHSINSTRPS